MRSLVIFLAFITFVRGNEVLEGTDLTLYNARIFETQINISSECFKDVFNRGNEEIGLPSFDPLAMRNLSFNFDTWGIEGLSGSIAMTDFVAWDLAKWILTHIKNRLSYNPLSYNLDTTTEWHFVQFRGLYHLDVNILGHLIRGSGRASIIINNFDVDVHQKVVITTGMIEELSIKMHMGKLECNIDEIMVDDFEITDLVNAFAGQLAPWINEHSDDIDEILSTMIMVFWNNIGYENFNTYDLGSIIDELTKCLY